MNILHSIVRCTHKNKDLQLAISAVGGSVRPFVCNRFDRLHCRTGIGSPVRAPEARQRLSKMVKIETFVFFDAETTGLGFDEHSPTRFTELAFVACMREHLLDTNKAKMPRVVSKLLLPINPTKIISPTVTELTGRRLSQYIPSHHSCPSRQTDTDPHYVAFFLPGNQQDWIIICWSTTRSWTPNRLR